MFALYRCKGYEKVALKTCFFDNKPETKRAYNKKSRVNGFF